MEDAFDMFHITLEAAICDHVPTVVLRRPFPPWLDPEAINALCKK